MLMLASVAAVVVVVGAFFLGVQPQLDRATAAGAEQASVEQTNRTTRQELERLREQAETLPTMQSDLAALQASVPDSAAVAPFITQLNATAEASGVKIASITVGDAMAYTPPAASSTDAGTPTDAGTSTDAASASPSASPSPTATPSAPKSPGVTTNGSITATNFSVIPVSVSVDGEFSEALAFVKGVQSDPRLFLVDSISSSLAEASSSDAAAGSAAPTWTFSGTIYVFKDAASTPAEQAAAAPSSSASTNG